MLKVLRAHFEGGGSHQNDFGLRKVLTSPSGALLRKTFVFDGAVAQSLDPCTGGCQEGVGRKF